MKHLDKLLHFILGCLLTFTFGLIDPIAGHAVCLVAAWLKEDYDRSRPDSHTRDGWDAYATVFGALPGQLLLRTPLADFFLQLLA